MAIEKNLRVMINFYKCLPVRTWNKKHLLKQVLPVTYTRNIHTAEKVYNIHFTLEGFVTSFCLVYTLYELSLDFKRREITISD